MKSRDINISFRVSNLSKVYEMGDEKVVALEDVSFGGARG